MFLIWKQKNQNNFSFQIQQLVAGTERNAAVCQRVSEKIDNFTSTCKFPCWFVCFYKTWLSWCIEKEILTPADGAACQAAIHF